MMLDKPASSQPPGLRSLAVMTTYACPAACASCGTVSNPNDRNHVSFDVIERAITEAKRLGFGIVVFTGGEATLRWEDLIKGIKCATALGLPTRLVTNAHWAKSPLEVQAALDELLQAGLCEINFSTGVEHAKFIPAVNVAAAARASLERKVVISVMIEVRSGANITRDTFLAQPEFADVSPEALRRLNIVESPWMPLDAFKAESYPQGMAIDLQNLHATRGCSSVLQTYVLGGDAKVSACCGLGMRIIDELKVSNARIEERPLEVAIEEAEQDLVKQVLRSRGPAKLLAWAARHDPAIQWEGMYAHACQACLRVYKDPVVKAAIQRHKGGLIAEFMSTAFIDRVLVPIVLDQVSSEKKPSDSMAALSEI